MPAHRLTSKNNDYPGVESDAYTGTAEVETKDPQWDPNSIGRARRPAVEPTDQTVTRDHNYVPYRGGQTHGVAFDNLPDDYRTDEEIIVTGAPVQEYGSLTADEQSPLLVRVLPDPSVKYRKQFQSISVLLQDTLWHTVLADRPTRTSAQFKLEWTSAAILAGGLPAVGRAWIVKRSGDSIESGFPINVGQGPFIVTHNEPMHVVCDPTLTGQVGNLQLVAIEEYEVPLPWVTVEQ
jgi:hypothetical protein